MKYVVYIVKYIFSMLLILYFLYSCVAQFIPAKNVPDCYYTDNGCQGDNRWGQ